MIAGAGAGAVTGKRSLLSLATHELREECRERPCPLNFCVIFLCVDINGGCPLPPSSSIVRSLVRCLLLDLKAILFWDPLFGRYNASETSEKFQN